MVQLTQHPAFKVAAVTQHIFQEMGQRVTYQQNHQHASCMVAKSWDTHKGTDTCFMKTEKEKKKKKERKKVKNIIDQEMFARLCFVYVDSSTD